MREFIADNWVWMAAIVICVIAAAGWLWWYGNYRIDRPGPMTRQQRQEFVDGTVYDRRERARQYQQHDLRSNDRKRRR